MTQMAHMNRRSFIVATAAAGGGLALGLDLLPRGVAVVGSRETSHYGLETAKKIFVGAPSRKSPKAFPVKVGSKVN